MVDSYSSVAGEVESWCGVVSSLVGKCCDCSTVETDLTAS